MAQQKIKVTFEDKGQDYLRWIVHMPGENSTDDWGTIEKCEPFAGIWEGLPVFTETLLIAMKPLICNKEDKVRQFNYRIIKLELMDMEEGK